jgi:hypothetical protein
MDGARRTVAVGLTAMIAAAGLLFAAPAADAITHARAKQIALRVLQPARQKGRVVVFTLRRRLGGREVVFPANPRAPRRVLFRRPGRARWFFWMDLLHDGVFAHRSVALTIDDRTGRVLSRQRWSWFPLVNGRRAPYIRTRRAYQSARWQIFNGIPRRIRTRRPGPACSRPTARGA